MQRRRFICDQIRSIEQERLERLERTPDTKPHAMVRLLARVTGIGIETADLLVPAPAEHARSPGGRALRRADRLARPERRHESRERYGLASPERDEISERRPTLTAPARDSIWTMRVGAKKWAFKSNKEIGLKEKIACREFSA